MVTKYILDPTVAVKWFASEDEPHLKEAEILFKQMQAEKVKVMTLDFLLVEVANALLISKKLNYHTTLQACKTLIASRIKFFPLSLRLLLEAIKLASIYNITVYDALYLAAAKQENAKVITADRALLQIPTLTISLSTYLAKNG